jgi:hypothetical protein
MQVLQNSGEPVALGVLDMRLALLELVVTEVYMEQQVVGEVGLVMDLTAEQVATVLEG